MVLVVKAALLFWSTLTFFCSVVCYSVLRFDIGRQKEKKLQAFVAFSHLVMSSC